MEPYERKRKAPPVPKFEQPAHKDPTVVSKVTDFLQEISREAADQAAIEKPTGKPAAAQPEKKKFSMESLNSKLNSIMSSKKIDLNKVVESSKKTTEAVVEQKNRRDIQVEYDPAHPNSYEQAKAHYAELFDKMRKGTTKPQEDEDQKISKLIAQYEKNEGEIQSNQDIQMEEVAESGKLDPKQTVALRMMQKYGFKVGEGLGKQSQGIRTPLTIKKLTDSSCKIEPSSISLASFVTVEQSAENALLAFKIEKSTIIALKVGIMLEQLTEDAQTQIRQQCEKYGNAIDWVSFWTSEGIIFFCRYPTKQQAFKAFTAINGRYYDQKIISVHFYPQHLFETKNFNDPLHQRIQF